MQNDYNAGQQVRPSVRLGVRVMVGLGGVGDADEDKAGDTWAMLMDEPYRICFQGYHSGKHHVDWCAG
jgi:hypothetical protein